MSMGVRRKRLWRQRGNNLRLPCSLTFFVKTRFLIRMLLSLRLSLKWPESWLVPNSRTRVLMEKGSFASLYRKETETGIIE